MGRTDILLVENSDTDIELVQHALHGHIPNMDLRVARDGVEALDHMFGPGCAPAAGRPQLLPKLVILDIEMPRVGGFEVLMKLKHNPHTASIPIVVFSSSASEKDIVASYGLGASSYVVKPVNFHDLTRTVRLMATYWVTLNRDRSTSRQDPMFWPVLASG